MIGIYIEIVHIQFRDPRLKYVASATLESWVPKNRFLAKKTNFKSAVKTKAFHIGSRNLVCTISLHKPTHYKNYCSITLREVAILI